MRSLHLIVEKTVVERYRVEVPDEFDDTDPQALEELFTEAVDMPKPYESRDNIFDVTVDDELEVDLKNDKSGRKA
jgi:hypothetical protein